MLFLGITAVAAVGATGIVQVTVGGALIAREIWVATGLVTGLISLVLSYRAMKTTSSAGEIEMLTSWHRKLNQQGRNLREKKQDCQGIRGKLSKLEESKLSAKQMQDLQSLITKLQGTVKRLQNENGSLRSQLLVAESSEKLAKRKLNSTIERFQNEIGSLKNQLAAAKKSAEQAKQQLNREQRQVADPRRQLRGGNGPIKVPRKEGKDEIERDVREELKFIENFMNSSDEEKKLQVWADSCVDIYRIRFAERVERSFSNRSGDEVATLLADCIQAEYARWEEFHARIKKGSTLDDLAVIARQAKESKSELEAEWRKLAPDLSYEVVSLILEAALKPLRVQPNALMLPILKVTQVWQFSPSLGGFIRVLI